MVDTPVEPFEEIDTGVFRTVTAERDAAIQSLKSSVAAMHDRIERFATAPRMRVLLIVEDNDMVVTAIERSLRSGNLDCTVAVASTVADARRQLLSRRFGVVLLDQVLPDGFGTDLVDDVPRSTYLVLMSGQVNEDMLARVGQRARARVFEKGSMDLSELVSTFELAFQGRI